MSLTTAQLQALKADIAADPVLNALPKNSDSAFEIAMAYNLPAVPSFTVWKTSVSIMAVGQAMLNSDVANLTTANTNRLSVLGEYSGGAFNPSLADVRSGFNDIFSVAGAATTRANLLALWRRFATRIEKLVATGTGSDASPAQLVFEGTINYGDVLNAWAS